jgi:methyltransferase
VSWVPLVVGLVALQRLAELIHAARNTRRLLARGAVEHGRRHYPLFALLHGSWLAAILLAVPWTTRPDPVLLGAFLLLQPLRLWVLLTLGERWTTRVIVLPGAPLVRRGPYRLLRHPNYAVVCAEIALLPLAFGAWRIALTFSILNAALLAWRIRVENAALANAAAGVEPGATTPSPRAGRP